MPSTPKREMRLKAFSSAYEYVKQYPHQSSNGRRELRAMEKENQKERPPSGTTAQPRDRSKMNSVDTVDTAIYAPALNGDHHNGIHGEESDDRHYIRSSTQSDGTVHRSKSIHSVDSDLPRSPNFVDMDDGTGQTAAPAELSKRGIHIPTRTRYVPANSYGSFGMLMWAQIH